MNCAENQARFLAITEVSVRCTRAAALQKICSAALQRCAHFIDRQRLFTSMGMRLVVDEAGKSSLEPLVESAAAAAAAATTTVAVENADS